MFLKARASDNQEKGNVTTNPALCISAPSYSGHQSLLGSLVRIMAPRPQPEGVRAALLTILGHSIAHRGATSHRGDGGQPGNGCRRALLLGTLPKAQPPVLSPA